MKDIIIQLHRMKDIIIIIIHGCAAGARARLPSLT
jgi:hypothetical protein